MKTLITLTNEGYDCVIRLHDDGVVNFVADADIDADGANGQNGARPAYMINNRGSEDLANGGMGIYNGKVIGINSWFKDIVILEDSKPKLFEGGIIASKTAYHYNGIDINSPSAYVDAETVPYVCVPPIVLTGVGPFVLGCKVICRHTINGTQVEGMVADVGPRSKAGEISIEMARRLGIPSNPRTGGESRPVIEYLVYPGVPYLFPSVAARHPVALLGMSGKYQLFDDNGHPL